MKMTMLMTPDINNPKPEKSMIANTIPVKYVTVFISSFALKYTDSEQLTMH